MTGANDWRLTNQAEYLGGVTLVRKIWVRPKPDWDHDHCAFCWAKFTDVDGPEFLREGYTTSDDYYWICPTCFIDFREQFGWHVVGE
jgi:hypothetical protein